MEAATDVVDSGITLESVLRQKRKEKESQTKERAMAEASQARRATKETNDVSFVANQVTGPNLVGAPRATPKARKAKTKARR